MAQIGINGVSISEVAKVLGTNATDVGTLCTHLNIQVWSKWKPIESNADTMTIEELQRCKFGIKIIEANTPSALISAINSNQEKGFKYDRPRTKFRLGDFRNYNSDAPIPCEKTYQDGEEIKIGGVTQDNHIFYERVCSGLETQPTDVTIGVDDIYYVLDKSGQKKSLNRGFYITDGTNSEWYTGKFYWWTTNMQKFSNKDVTIYEFYTNVTKGADGVIRHPDNPELTGSTAEDRFFAIPYPKYTKHIKGDSPSGSKIVATMLDAEIVPIPGQPMNFSKIAYNVYFDAVGDLYRGGTITNVWVKLCRDKKGYDIIDSKKLTDTLNVPNETKSQTFSGTFYNKGKDVNTPPDPNVWVIVWYNGLIQGETMPMMTKPDIQH